MQGTTTAVRAHRTDPYSLPQQPAAGAALHENQTIPLVFKYLGVLDVEVASEQFDELGVGERPRNARLWPPRSIR